MIRNSPIGVSPTLVVTINDAPVNYESLNAITIDLKENEHDYCEIVMAGVPTRSITEYIGKSVYVHIDTGASYVTEFFGTIEQSLPTATTNKGRLNSNLFQEVKFVCLGCSYAMRGNTSRVWSGQTLAQVAGFLCDLYGFSLDVPQDILTFDNFIQSTESDWQIIVRYASMMGYRVNVHGTHMHIYDPFRALGRLPSLHRFVTPLRADVVASPGQVISFDGSFAQRAADGRYFDTIATVIGDDGTTYDVSTSDVQQLTSPARFANNINTFSDTYQEARRVILSEYKSRYDYKADAVVLGAAGMVPGGVVLLDKYDGLFDGYWYVHGVRQVVKSGSFITSAQLRKNQVDTLVDMSAQGFTQPPAPKFINGWTTSQRRVNVYT